ncbi:MAG: undecaprenyldiphospho-muramoylpentapeptide beta-N-acetylglucosaminyltransferase [Acidobacteria bacterium RIFCSPLOWO2_12_FULL_54_10]|nr:MAG: undecaprenyldiphospho-muramoylpentapeptide beta-N-acetylglucosaminyltransferase [Acidobacteria bacterium RIFCSPLOWO2_12_FULL_54_10]
MKLLCAAGGTGGHVLPALVVAQEFCRRDMERRVLFVGTARGAETRLVPQAGYPLDLLTVGALQGQGIGARLRTLLGLPAAFWKALRILKEFQPDVVLGVGGYAAGPVMLAAIWKGIPVAVLEPNAVPGLANRWVGPYVARAFVAFEEALRFFRPGKGRVTGIPIRPEFFSIPIKTHQAPFTVLVFGGSQGARTLNRAVVEALPFLAQRKVDLMILLQAGQKEYDAVRDACSKTDARVEVFAYAEQMSELFGKADLVVCRAGANTIAELSAAGRASILVPYPTAADQHQLRNAEAMERVGAARLIVDKEFSGERFAKEVWELLHDAGELRSMEKAARAAAHADATERIVEEIERLGEKNRA